MSDRYRLDSCVWELTLACCFSCRYCGSKAGRARGSELTTAECLDVAAQLSQLGCRRVSLIGGEIFLRPDWAEIVQALTSRGVKTAIITNGFLFTPALLRRLRELSVESVAVSLDAPREVHDAYRQEGSYDRALAALDALAAGGIPASVITTLHSENVPLLPELYAVLRPIPIFAWQLQACSPMGNAALSGLDWRIDSSVILQFVRNVQADAPFFVGVADNIGYLSPDDALLRGASRPFSGCGAGLCSIGIDSAGNVRGCESMYDERFNEGNLRQRRLTDIWNDPDAFAYNRRFTPALLTGSCALCPNGPRCAAGCRSYNYFTTGRLYESPLCVSRPLP